MYVFLYAEKPKKKIHFPKNNTHKQKIENNINNELKSFLGTFYKILLRSKIAFFFVSKSSSTLSLSSRPKV